MMKFAQDSYSPSHPALFSVDFGVNSKYRSVLRAQKRFEAGEVICNLEEPSKASESDAYTTVQCGPRDRYEVRNDLAYG